MLRFENPIYFWLLLVVPVLLVIYFLVWRQRRKKMHKLGDPALLEQLMPDVSRFRPLVKFLLLLLALVVLVCMLARPQMGTKISHEKRSGIETIIALDISNSMMAEDVQPSRLAKSKLLVENLVDHFTNDRIGLVVFAGDAFVQLPITTAICAMPCALMLAWLKKIRPKCSRSGNTSSWRGRLAPPESTR